MPSTLAEQITELFAKGKGQGEPPFLPLVTLDSEARYGLDAELRWVLVAPDAAPLVIDRSNAHLLHEALEWKRSRFDDAVTESARALGLPEDEIVDSFPVFDVVRAIFDKKVNFLTRLALGWLRPSELREVRADILLISKDRLLPGPLRDLAERLVVPE
jgi:hypothetical protein